jgi:hypothetical protein
LDLLFEKILGFNVAVLPNLEFNFLAKNMLFVVLFPRIPSWDCEAFFISVFCTLLAAIEKYIVFVVGVKDLRVFQKL